MILIANTLLLLLYFLHFLHLSFDLSSARTLPSRIPFLIIIYCSETIFPTCYDNFHINDNNENLVQSLYMSLVRIVTTSHIGVQNCHRFPCTLVPEHEFIFHMNMYVDSLPPPSRSGVLFFLAESKSSTLHWCVRDTRICPRSGTRKMWNSAKLK